jgi:hypothetical protein
VELIVVLLTLIYGREDAVRLVDQLEGLLGQVFREDVRRFVGVDELGES